jgi:hypothetical protein
MTGASFRGPYFKLPSEIAFLNMAESFMAEHAHSHAY